MRRISTARVEPEDIRRIDEMTVETPRVASLRAKLKAREGKSEYKKNCEEIRKEIARLTDCQDLDL